MNIDKQEAFLGTVKRLFQVKKEELKAQEAQWEEQQKNKSKRRILKRSS